MKDKLQGLVKDTASGNTVTNIGTGCVVIMGLATLFAPKIGMSVDDMVLSLCVLASLQFGWVAFTSQQGRFIARIFPAGKAIGFAIWSFYAATRGAGTTYNEHQLKSAPTLESIAGQAVVVQAGFLSGWRVEASPCSPMVQPGGITGLQALVWYNGSKVWAPVAGGALQINDRCEVLTVVAGVNTWLAAVTKVGW